MCPESGTRSAWFGRVACLFDIVCGTLGRRRKIGARRFSQRLLAYQLDQSRQSGATFRARHLIIPNPGVEPLAESYCPFGAETKRSRFPLG